jgi:preprotein translocase subunit YajC
MDSAAGLLLIPIFLVMLYVLVVLPQQRRVRAHQAVVDSLAPGQDVMTTSGLYGRLVAVDDETARLEIAPGVEVKVARASVGLVVDDTSADESTADESTADESTAGDPSEPSESESPA